MAKLEFGLLIHPTPRGGTVPAMLATNERLLAEAVAHDLPVWFIDHFQFDSQPLLECFAMLAHTVGRYPTLRSGTLVAGQSYRNPALTAKIASTLQFLTGGRFILGIGAGWKEDEYHAYGYPYPSAKVRIEQLEDAVRIIKGLWGSGPVSFAGEHYRVMDAYNEPRADPAPTLMIGGGGERRTLRVVAEHADWWNADYYTVSDYGRKLERLRGYCRELGRDEDAVVPTYYAGISVSHDPSRVIRRPPLSYRPDEMFVLHGNPDEVSAQIAQFAALGVRQIQLNFLDFPRTDGIDLFFSEVFPRFQ
ncbi:MAG: hypothetical protein AVDCRST_MAG18-889 [uncultured Thermomicrobiales bacterium]|uniref:Luciferase-like domain-containing protein n=1 Tax=uncultured Thermomicrobiales bacterium TaxID=1645740 RepID=A0A6J4UUT4_9BACT|nr:MAG: hypothetical protein AVDCRST_MAG18-889 [uncultured Thermomicrobiales bacterium]